ncbi:hypothetical protein PIB30_098348, partial [Stylosanthes scabra]|nr:hypothetical protein [Stylosanthes scabra]
MIEGSEGAEGNPSCRYHQHPLNLTTTITSPFSRSHHVTLTPYHVNHAPSLPPISSPSSCCSSKGFVRRGIASPSSSSKFSAPSVLPSPNSLVAPPFDSAVSNASINIPSSTPL